MASWIDLPRELSEGERRALFDTVRTNLAHLDDDPSWQSIASEASWALLGGVEGEEFDVLRSLRESPSGGSSWKIRYCIHAGRLYRLAALGERESIQNQGWKRMVGSFRFVE